MLLHKVKTALLAILVVGTASSIAGTLVLRAAQQPANPDPKAVKAAPTSQVDPNLATRIPFNPLAVQQWRGENHPNVESIPVFGVGSLLLVKSRDGRAYDAWSDEVDPDKTGGWQKFTVPDGVKVTPLCSFDSATFVYEGKTIDEVAAFSAKHGLWERVKLRAPLTGVVEPLLGPGFVLYQGGNVFYAFSSEKGVWSVLEVASDGAEPATTSSTENHILVRQGKRLYAFSLKQGKWSMPVEMDAAPK